MKRKRYFIFLTEEGFTYSPNPKTIEPDVDNLQVIGFVEADDHKEAFKNQIQQYSEILNTGFNEIFCLELKEKLENAKYFYLNEIKNNLKTKNIQTNNQNQMQNQ